MARTAAVTYSLRSEVLVIASGNPAAGGRGSLRLATGDSPLMLVMRGLPAVDEEYSKLNPLKGFVPVFCATATNAKASDCVLYHSPLESWAAMSSSSGALSASRPSNVMPMSTAARSRSSEPKV